MKLTDILKDSGIELGKVYTDKDMPPFQVNEYGTKTADLVGTPKKEFGKLYPPLKTQMEAKGFAFSSKYMSFKIGRNSKGINFVRIGHNAKDLYDMEFGFVSVKGIKVKKKVKDVYADMLGQIFKKHTGMNVRL